jgi:hypothetical protein
MEILRYEVLESIDIETLSDLFAGYPVQICITTSGLIEFWLDDDSTAADFELDISQKMEATCSARLMVAWSPRHPKSVT